jgi:hypothetical protein
MIERHVPILWDPGALCRFYRHVVDGIGLRQSLWRFFHDGKS